MSDTYDSTQDTKDHISAVRAQLDQVQANIMLRARVHDRSKLEDPEKAVFDVVTPKLRGLTYGSDEYKVSLAEMGVALHHHYEHNSHHPEHYKNGISGMSLLDLIEMLCDWKAATERHADGDYDKSLVINRDRFKISPQLFDVIVNTAKELGFIPDGWSCYRFSWPYPEVVTRTDVFRWMNRLAVVWQEVIEWGCDPMYDDEVRALQMNILRATGIAE